MRTTRQVTALVILIGVFLPVLFAAMTLLSLRPWLLERSFYQQIVSDERIYNALLTNEIPNEFNLQVLTTDDQLPLAALNAALPQVVSPDYLRTQAINIVDDTFDFIDGNGGRFEAALDFTPIKSALAGEAGVRFADALANALPTCSAGQSQVAPGGHLARCIAPNTTISETSAQIVEALPAALETMPDHLILNSVHIFSDGSSTFGWWVGGNVRSALDFGIIALVLIAVISGIVGSWIGGNDARNRLKWFSSALFFPASLFVVTGLSLSTPLVLSLLRTEVSFDLWTDTTLSESFRQAIVDVVVPLVQKIGNGFLMVGIVGFVIAAVLLVGSWLFRASQERATYKVVHVPVQNS
jgi:hypothetical protein